MYMRLENYGPGVSSISNKSLFALYIYFFLARSDLI